MSLLSEAMESCVMVSKTTVSDGYGGESTAWTEGESFDAAIVFDASVQARIAEKDGVTSRYTVTTAKTTVLQYDNYFKRTRDSKYFHVTSDGDDRFTPASAGLDMRQVEAEEITELPE